MEITPELPRISKTMGKTGLPSMGTKPVLRNSSAPSPSAVMPTMVSKAHLVLQTL